MASQITTMNQVVAPGLDRLPLNLHIKLLTYLDIENKERCDVGIVTLALTCRSFWADYHIMRLVFGKPKKATSQTRHCAIRSFHDCSVEYIHAYHKFHNNHFDGNYLCETVALYACDRPDVAIDLLLRVPYLFRLTEMSIVMMLSARNYLMSRQYDKSLGVAMGNLCSSEAAWSSQSYNPDVAMYNMLLELLVKHVDIQNTNIMHDNRGHYKYSARNYDLIVQFDNEIFGI